MSNIATLLILILAAARLPAAERGTVALHRDDSQGQMQILIDGKEALVYQYGKDADVAHYYPVRSPSGKLLTVEVPEPYPHHRSFWFADNVQLEGQPKSADLFNALYSQADGKKELKAPYRVRIRHVKFLDEEAAPGRATIKSQSIWEGNFGETPLVDETRAIRVVPLGHGEYFLDCRFQVTAAYGNVTFRSDATHYAWPYVRMHPQFAVERLAAPLVKTEQDRQRAKQHPAPPPEKGTGVITSSEGGVGEAATYMKPARWIDFSGTVEGTTEGLAIFANPRQPPPKFFVRGYGTFGPRRPDAQSGKPFVLKKGDSLEQGVGILVHRGDANAGRVAERFQAYADGKL